MNNNACDCKIKNIAEIEEYTKESAELKLLDELNNSEKIGNRFGWKSSEEVFNKLSKKYNLGQ